VHRSKSTGSLDRFDPSAASNRLRHRCPAVQHISAAIEATHKELDKDQTLGVQLDTRSPGKGQKLQLQIDGRLCIREDVRHPLRRRHADTQHTPEALQDMLNAYDAVLSAYGMVISQTKTKVMVYRPLEPVTRCQHTSHAPRIPPHKHQYNQLGPNGGRVTGDGGSGEGSSGSRSKQ
jgi:hypothetical protein